MVAEYVGVVPYHIYHVPGCNYVHTEDRSSFLLLVLDTVVIFSIESNTVNTQNGPEQDDTLIIRT